MSDKDERKEAKETKETVEGVIKESVKLNTQKTLGYNGETTKLIPYREPYPTREVDLETEGYMVDKVKESRGKLTSDYKKSGNFAYAEVDVEGVDQKDFYVHSSIDKFKGTLEERVPDMPLKLENPTFEAQNAFGKNGDTYHRGSDTENKIFNHIDLSLKGNTNAKGKIKMITEKDTCISCNINATEFSNKYPNIELELIYNVGEKMIKP